jgi:hypothetical protein
LESLPPFKRSFGFLFSVNLKYKFIMKKISNKEEEKEVGEYLQMINNLTLYYKGEEIINFKRNHKDYGHFWSFLCESVTNGGMKYREGYILWRKREERISAAQKNGSS